MFRLIAITAADTAAQIASIGMIAGERVAVVSALGLSAILVHRKKPFLQLAFSKKAELEGLVQNQRLLEGLLGFGPLLAAPQAPQIENEADALGVIAAHARRLREGLAEFGSHLQFQISVKLDAAKALAALKNDPEIKAALAGGGAALRDAMLARRDGMAAEATRHLRSCSLDTLSLPGEGDDVLINMVVMIAHDGEPALDAAVNAIDSMLTEALSIRYVGPLPALSFASISIEEPNERDVTTALKRFGLSSLGTPQDMRAAYIATMRREHPDVAEGATDAGEHAGAYKLLMRLAEAEQEMRDAGATSVRKRRLLELKRDGDAKPARKAA
jgi:hypothetical protein